MTSGLLTTTSIEVTRPDIPPGPMFLGAIFFSKSIEMSWANRENDAKSITSKIDFFIS